LKSGKQYRIFMAPSAHKRYKKFDSSLQQKVKQEVLKLAKDPHQYEELRGPLRGIKSYHFKYKKIQYRIAYRIREDQSRIETVLVKSRESFYKVLRRLIK